MVELYERDAAVVAEVLTRLVEMYEEADRTLPTASYERLAQWTPRDLRATYAPELVRDLPKPLTSARLKSILAAIAEQRGSDQQT